jgi:predicted transcriptional regulator
VVFVVKHFLQEIIFSDRQFRSGIESTLSLSIMKRIFHFRASSSQLGPLEERLLEVLWLRGHATVRDLVNVGGPCQDLAYTTVMTTLDRLFKKDLLSREAEGRAFRYTPRFTREELHREVAGEAFRQLLDASPASSLPLSYLVEILSDRDAHLLDDLREAVESKRRQLKSGNPHHESEPKDKA